MDSNVGYCIKFYAQSSQECPKFGQLSRALYHCIPFLVLAVMLWPHLLLTSKELSSSFCQISLQKNLSLTSCLEFLNQFLQTFDRHRTQPFSKPFSDHIFLKLLDHYHRSYERVRETELDLSLRNRMQETHCAAFTENHKNQKRNSHRTISLYSKKKLLPPLPLKMGRR